MKKILIFLVCMFFVTVAYADRNVATVTVKNSSTLVKRGDAKIYSISFVATATNGNFIVYDAVTATNGYADVATEGSEATSGNSKFYDFSNKPLELGTGLYVAVTSGYLVLRYE